MKILFVQTTITRYMHPLLEKIADFGHTLVMLIPEVAETGKAVKGAESTSCKYQVVKSPTKKMWYGKSGYPQLQSILAEQKPDILLIGWPYFMQLYFQKGIFKTLKNNNIRLILREIPFQVCPNGNISWYNDNPIIDENMAVKSHGLMFRLRMRLLMRVRKFLYSKADAAICYCSEGKHILPTYGIKPDNIFVTGNCTDTDTLYNVKQSVEVAEPLLPKRTRILHIGRLVKWKRVDLLINAFKTVLQQHPDVELAIVGSGPEEENLKNQAITLGITDNVKFYGAVYDEFTLGRYMYESTIYVLAGMGGLSINDAMTYGLPVIVSICDGTEKDLVEDGVNGFFFKNGDSVDLAAKINAVLADSERTKTMGEKSELIIRERFTISKVAENFHNAFRSLAIP